VISAHTLRRSFLHDFIVQDPVVGKHHSHPRAAAGRTMAAEAIDQWIHCRGLNPYNISRSSRDGATRGFHQFFMARDVSAEPARDRVGDKDVIKMVDVDYYVDLKFWIAEFRPILMYTFVPDSAGGRVEDANFSITSNVVDYRVDGGAHYSHSLWDYSHDFVVVDYWWGSTVCSVETQMVSPSRRIVGLFPVYVIYTPLGWLLPGQRLGRLEMTHGKGDAKHNAIQVFDGKEDLTSVSREGERFSVTLPSDMFRAIQIRFRESKHPCIADVERFLKNYEKLDGRACVKAALLFDFLATKVAGDVSTVARGGQVRTQKRPPSFQTTGCNSDGYLASEDGKESGRVVAPSMVTKSDVVPVDSYNNDLMCVKGRVDDVRNTTIPPGVYAEYAREFVQLVVSDPGVGVPWDLSQVRVNQDRPLQRVRAEKEWAWMTLNPDDQVKAFQKKETYGSVNHPRNISTVSTRQTLNLSCYTYAFKNDVLKKCRWYVPGLKPQEVADRVQEYASLNKVLCQTDFSRFDGTISRWLRENIERPSYLRWSAAEWESHLRSLLEADAKCHAVTRHGIRYDTDDTRLSGSPITTDGNTPINAFVSFAAYRNMGLCSTEAYDRLGLYAGDDGITGAPPAEMEKAAKDLGLKLKCEGRKEGESVSFLGRVFLDPWTRGDSVQDPMRTIRKLHISFSPTDIPEEVALYWRACGYLSLDPNAPLVSDWCRLVFRHLNRLHTDIEDKAEKFEERCVRDVPYFVQQADRDGSGTWPQPPKDDELAWTVVAESLGITPSELGNVITAIRRNPGYLDQIEGLVETETLVKIAAVPKDGTSFHRVGNATPRSQVSIDTGVSTSSTRTLTSSLSSSSPPLNYRKRRSQQRAAARK